MSRRFLKADRLTQEKSNSLLTYLPAMFEKIDSLMVTFTARLIRRCGGCAVLNPENNRPEILTELDHRPDGSFSSVSFQLLSSPL